MALKKDKIFFNVTFKDAYHVIDTFRYFKQENDNSNNSSISVNVFSSESDSKNTPLNATPLEYTFMLKTELATQNPIKKGYEYLKTLLEYQDSTDG